ncbi:MAG: hypothetical protein IKR86_00480 [Candidatus Methanomethylophilaceae archaeon]|nr:hypothetical protein [Candidatus Methanomethylophilaceae archaeon]
MYEFSTRERMMLHLSRFSNLDVNMEFGAPADITQDGAAAALGITRSHACTTLLRMEKAGEVLTGLSRVSGSNCKVKKKIYVLSEHGKEVLSGLLDSLEATGVPRSELTLQSPVNRMSADMMRAMPREERDVVGMLCVLRGKVERQRIDLRGFYGMPFDGRGNLCIRKDARERFLQTADEDDLARWHSAAADIYQSSWEDLPERLYHLLRSNRLREALKLASDHRFAIADSRNAGIAETVRALCERTGDERLSLIAALLSLRVGDVPGAESALRTAGDGDRAKAMRAEVLLAEGRTEEALETALGCYSEDVCTSLALGKCMLAAGRAEEALVYLRMSRRRMMESGCLFRLDEVMEQEAMADKALGRCERADALEEAARATRKSGSDRRRGRTRGCFRERCCSSGCLCRRCRVP